MTSYIKGTTLVVNHVPTLQLGQVSAPYMTTSISYDNNTFLKVIPYQLN